MARKTFVSYKHSEAQGVRDDILDALGEDASYYQGETSDSPDLTDTSTQNIKRNLADMIHGTSVTIVVISPNLKESKWIDWEIEYSLKEIPRADNKSRTNGIVGVIMKHNGDYTWIAGENSHDDGCKARTIKDSKLYKVISANRYNLKKPKYACERCKTVDVLSGSYISLIKETYFLKDPSKYIENAYEKSQDVGSFKISKTR